MRSRTILLVLFLLGCAILPSDLLAQGCAMCKAQVESQQGTFGGEQAIGAGLNKGILFLIAIPYVLLFLLFRKKIKSFFKEFANAQG